MNLRRRFVACAILIALTASAAAAGAQERMTDDQLKNLIERVEKSTDNFRAALDSSLDKSLLDGSRTEDNINQFVKDFEQAADRLEDRYGDRNAAAGLVSEVLRRASFIDNFMLRHALTPSAQSSWATLRTQLDDLARAYQVSWSWAGVSGRPYRASENEIKSLLERIEKGADRFSDSLKDALSETRAGSGRAEENVNQFAKDLETATDRLKNQFSDDYAAVGMVTEVLRRGVRLDRFMRRHQLTARAQSDWSALRRDLDELARAYNVSVNWDAPTITIITWQ
jgi:DNA-binding TFAR19-related protein (PDSD5 family)/mRNA-degrading endonuclease YafQ of YafQ-DinJ toxin-antitoxin module